MSAIGIDLGTTNSVAAYWDGHAARVIDSRRNGGLLPSILSWKAPVAPATEGQWLVGLEAYNNWQYAPEDTVFCIKRLMGRWFNERQVEESREHFTYRVVGDEHESAAVKVGGQVLTPATVSSRYLQELRRRAERELGRQVTSAVITVPAYFQERQRAATREAGEEAGLRVRRLIDEPTAAAIAFGVTEVGQRHFLLVFDLGGGTLDISIMQLARNRATGQPMFHVNTIDGDIWLGGSDFDQEIVNCVVDDFRKRHGVDPRNNREFMAIARQEAERRKIDLSETDIVRLAVPVAYHADGLCLEIDTTLHRDRFESMISKYVERAMQAVERALHKQSIRPDEITTVLLVGGATRTPLVRRRLEEYFGPGKIRADLDPMTVVACGAAIMAAKIQGIECPNPECGPTREVTDARSGTAISVHDPHVNDDARETCEVCGTSLAAGKTVSDIGLKEPIERSLGIIAAKPGNPNSFVELIRAGSLYPLEEPVKRVFYPNARCTTSIKVPIYSAVDDRGTDRCQQGVVVCQFQETVTSATPVEVSFNLDRSREVTVTVQVMQSSQPPVQQRIEHKEPPPELRPGVSLHNQFLNLIQHVGEMVKLYGDFLEPAGLRADAIRQHLADADRAIDDAERNQRPITDITTIKAMLEKDLMESGVATQLYLAYLAAQHASDEARNRLATLMDAIMIAFREGRRDDVERWIAELKTVIAEIWVQRQPGAILEFDPHELLTDR